MVSKMRIISIVSIFLILVTVTIGTVSANTSPAEKKQDSRLSVLESNVKKILTRLDAIEKKLLNIQSPPYTATFGTWTEYASCSSKPESPPCFTFNFTLEKVANVFIMVNGIEIPLISSNNLQYTSTINIDEENSIGPDWIIPVQDKRLSLSRNFQLKAGKHSIRVYSSGFDNDKGESFDVAISDLTISVIANQKGKIDQPNDYFK
jgi:hypothetical protein